MPRNYAGRIHNTNPNFKGETDAMKSHVFLTFEECNNDKSMFTNTLQHLGMYINIKMDFSDDLVLAYHDLKMPVIPLPPENIPTDDAGNVTDLWRLLWNEEVKRYTKRKGKLQDNLSATIYAIVCVGTVQPRHASRDQVTGRF